MHRKENPVQNKPGYQYMFFFGTLMNRVVYRMSGSFFTKEKFILSDGRGFPRIAHPDQFPEYPCGNVKGTLHEIPSHAYNEIRRGLDYYEGYPDFYNRVFVEITDEDNNEFLAEMYFSVRAQDGIFDTDQRCLIPDENGVLDWANSARKF